MMLICVGVNLVLTWTVSDGHFLQEWIEKSGEKCKANENKNEQINWNSREACEMNLFGNKRCSPNSIRQTRNFNCKFCE